MIGVVRPMSGHYPDVRVIAYAGGSVFEQPGTPFASSPRFRGSSGQCPKGAGRERKRQSIDLDLDVSGI